MHIMQILCVESNMWSFPHTPTYQSERVALKFISITVEQWSKSLLNCNCKCYLHPYIILALFFFFFCFYCYSVHLRWISNGNIFNVKWRLVSGQTVCMHSSVYKTFFARRQIIKRSFQASIHTSFFCRYFFSIQFLVYKSQSKQNIFWFRFFFPPFFSHTVLIASTISSKQMLVFGYNRKIWNEIYLLFSLEIDFMMNLQLSSS